MNRLLNIVLLFPLIAFGGLDEKQAGQLLDTANVYYESGRLEEAIENYTLLSRDFQSATVEYNLGNAYFRKGENTDAILHYERALRLRPNDEDIAHNLEQARQATVDRIESDGGGRFSAWWNSKLLSVGPDRWATFSILASLLTFLGAVGYFLLRSMSLRRIGFLTASFAMALTVVFLWFSLSSKSSLLSTSEAIIYSAKVEILSAPDRSSKELFVLHEGTKVEILRESGSWMEIRLANGNVGWLERGDVAII